ncbi:hypothetical protein [Halomarina rubra]|uniref:Uncharacterized protein n=1 Tax=Halomarina rubra TaxID=2071873 RepID=A0ABD6AU96_9EURY|nr:hypothetical protein [Halomarina rubra]
MKYVLEPSAFYSGDAVEREGERTGEEQVVVDVADIDDATVRGAVETAIRDGEWRSNTAPEGLAETVERVDFFTGPTDGDTATHVGLTLYRFDPDSPPAVEFSASVVDDTVSAASPGAVEFTLTNSSETTQLVYAGTVPPFGAVFAQAVDADERFLLWREYEEEGCISFSDRGMTACSIGSVTELAPSDGVTRRYEVLPTGTTNHPEFTVPPGPGTYRVTDSLSYSAERGAPGSTLSVDVAFTLESA